MGRCFLRDVLPRALWAPIVGSCTPAGPVSFTVKYPSTHCGLLPSTPPFSVTNPLPRIFIGVGERLSSSFVRYFFFFSFGLELAEILISAGVHAIEAGFVSGEDAERLRLVSEAPEG